MPCRRARAPGGEMGAPVRGSAASILVGVPDASDSGQTTIGPSTKNEPCARPVRTIRSTPFARSLTCTSVFPSPPTPCVHVASPPRTSGCRHGLAQKWPLESFVAAPICSSVPVRESHAKVVKSAKKSESEWYSFQTNQRPVEASVCLVVARAGEAADARDASRACVDPDNPREVRRVELREEPSPVARADDRKEGRSPGERDDRARQDPVPGRRLRCAAPPGRGPVRRARGGAENERGEHRQRANRHALSVGRATAGNSLDLAARYRT